MSVSSILFNGELANPTEFEFGFQDLGLNRGYAVFDFMKKVNGRFPFIEEHLERFIRSAQYANLKCPYGMEALTQQIFDLDQKSGNSNAYFKLLLTGGFSENSSTYHDKSNLIITTGPLQLAPEDLICNGARLLTKQYSRTMPHIKTTDYFFAMANQTEMVDKKAVDLLYYDQYIRETSRANIFFVKNDRIYTPAEKILEGITRQKVLLIAPDIVVKDLSPDWIETSDEVFITSTTKTIMPITQIDDVIIGDGKVGPVSRRILQEYRKLCLS